MTGAARHATKWLVPPFLLTGLCHNPDRSRRL